MIKKRGKMRRGMVVFANALPAIGEFAAGLWRSDSGKSAWTRKPTVVTVMTVM